MTLGSADQAFRLAHGDKENASEVLSSITSYADYKRQIEQVGSAYEKLKVRVSKHFAREEERKKHGHKHGLHADTESESSEEEEQEAKKDDGFNQDWERKRKRRTKDDIEREALLMGDLYAVLGIDHLMYEAGDGDIKSAYKKLALMYHPDKIGETIT